MSNYGYFVTYSNRKTIGLIVRDGQTLEIKAPYGTPDSAIRDMLLKHERWITKHLAKGQERGKGAPQQKLSSEELVELARQAADRLPPLVRYYAEKLHVSYGRITVRAQRSRWGSCSSGGNLSFNCLLMLMPPECMEYVVAHELCHRLEMNHSPRFWTLVKSVLPDYKAAYDWLKKNGPAIVGRLP